MSSKPETVPAEPWGADTDYESYVLHNIDDAIDEWGTTICARCPAAIWYQQGVTHCFCSIMKMVTWPSGIGQVITMCDAREAAVAAYAIELAKLATKKDEDVKQQNSASA